MRPPAGAASDSPSGAQPSSHGVWKNYPDDSRPRHSPPAIPGLPVQFLDMWNRGESSFSVSCRNPWITDLSDFCAELSAFCFIPLSLGWTTTQP